MVSARARCLPAMSMSRNEGSSSTHLADCAAKAGVAELPVHVVVARARLVPDDHSVDLHTLVRRLVHLKDRDKEVLRGWQ